MVEGCRSEAASNWSRTTISWSQIQHYRSLISGSAESWYGHEWWPLQEVLSSPTLGYLALLPVSDDYATRVDQLTLESLRGAATQYEFCTICNIDHQYLSAHLEAYVCNLRAYRRFRRRTSSSRGTAILWRRYSYPVWTGNHRSRRRRHHHEH